MHSDRYTNLVDPQNAAVRKLLLEVLEPRGRAQSPAISKRQCLEDYLLFLRDFKYFNVSGLTSLEQTIAARSGNCLSLVCLLCSLLRSAVNGCAGFSDSEAFAAIGCPKGFHLTRMHAYAIIRGLDEDNLLLVDPEVMRLKSIDYDDLSANYSLFVVFNDQKQAAEKEEIRRLLVSEPSLVEEARAKS